MTDPAAQQNLSVHPRVFFFFFKFSFYCLKGSTENERLHGNLHEFMQRAIFVQSHMQMRYKRESTAAQRCLTAAGRKQERNECGGGKMIADTKCEVVFFSPRMAILHGNLVQNHTP